MHYAFQSRIYTYRKIGTYKNENILYVHLFSQLLQTWLISYWSEIIKKLMIDLIFLSEKLNRLKIFGCANSR